MTGTPVFLAPEVLQGLIYDSAADIYSLAIIMWEMWYGREIASDVFNTVKVNDSCLEIYNNCIHIINITDNTHVCI